MTFGVGLSCGKRGTDPDSRAEARVGWDARSGCRRGGGWGELLRDEEGRRIKP